MSARIWERAIAMVVNCDRDGPALEDFAQLLKSAGFSAVLVQSTSSLKPQNQVPRIREWLEAFQTRGFSRGIWSYLGPEPEQEADLAHSQITECGARFFVANAEIEYKFTQAQGTQDADAFGRSERFVRRFRQLRPTIGLGLSSYGRFDQADIHYAVWLNEGNARALPQSYPNEQGESWEPEPSYLGAVDVKQPHNVMRDPRTGAVIPGFPKAYVHLTIPKPDPDDPHVYSVEDYVAMLHDARVAGHPLGFSAYEIEAWRPEDIVKLGEGIRTHNLAFLPT
jgi:hypothetical protein